MRKKLITASLLMIAFTLINASDTTSVDQNTVLTRQAHNLKPQKDKYVQPIQAEESGLSNPQNVGNDISNQANELVSAAAGNQPMDEEIVRNANKAFPENNRTQNTQLVQPIQANESCLSTPNKAEDSESSQANELISSGAGNQPVDKEILKNANELYPKTTPSTEQIKQQQNTYVQPIQAEESGLSTPKHAEDSASEQANDFVSAGAGNQPVDKEILKNANELYPKTGQPTQK
ncbi:MAG TPA: hypothetical protein QF753_09905 [Victivallales bacterium]|nr:hypothetical protein [Victivallales bacterium]